MEGGGLSIEPVRFVKGKPLKIVKGDSVNTNQVFGRFLDDTEESISIHGDNVVIDRVPSIGLRCPNYSRVKRILERKVERAYKLMQEGHFRRMTETGRLRNLNILKQEMNIIPSKGKLSGYQAEELQRVNNAKLVELYDLQKQQWVYEDFLSSAEKYLQNGFQELTVLGQKRKLTGLKKVFPEIDDHKVEKTKYIEQRASYFAQLVELCSEHLPK
ncbi:hypothetical protein GOV14_04555 [Candidatus Pacearchaeota archaeon]|nr:hypothetical protein [Candidatus Pacearchaeota archaeon]